MTIVSQLVAELTKVKPALPKESVRKPSLVRDASSSLQYIRQSAFNEKLNNNLVRMAVENLEYVYYNSEDGNIAHMAAGFICSMAAMNPSGCRHLYGISSEELSDADLEVLTKTWSVVIKHVGVRPKIAPAKAKQTATKVIYDAIRNIS